MSRSRWRMFLTVFLVVFLGGLGVSGAAALWSMQTTVTAQITTGTWGPSPTPTPTTTPSASPTASATPTATPTPTSTPTPSPTPTPTWTPTSQPWTPCLRVTVVDKNNPVQIKLQWNASAEYAVTRIEVRDGKNGDRSVEMSRDRLSAVLYLPNGTADYNLILFTTTATGASQKIERLLSFQPSGKEGEVSISPNACS